MSDTPSELTALALNSGSSSLKFGLYRVGASRTDTLFTGVAESIGEPNSRFRMRDSQGNTLTHDTAPIRSQREAVIRIGKLFDDAKTPAPEAIGHRVVHGGPKLRQHCLIDEGVSQQLEHAAVFSPLHTPATISAIRFAQNVFRAFRRWHVSTPPFTLKCPMSRVCLQFPRNCNHWVSNVTAFTAFPANRSFVNLETTSGAV